MKILIAGLGSIGRRHFRNLISLGERNLVLYRTRKATLPDDELELSTWIYDVRRVTATRHYQIHRAGDGALLAQVNTVGVWVDVKTGQPVRIPEAMRIDFEANIGG